MNSQAPPSVPAPIPTGPIQSPFERYSEIVEKNPLDFNSWVQLIAVGEAETSLDPARMRRAFDAFLTEFPLCFGYWNKYAQYELRLSQQQKNADSFTTDRIVRGIYERGVAAIPYSVDMWVNYCSYLLDTLRVNPSEGRAHLERALEACGSDANAGPLWDKYILLETQHNEMEKLNVVFKRVLSSPLQNVADYWEKYNHFVLAQQLSTLASREELEALESPGENLDESALRLKVVAQVEAIKNQTTAIVEQRQEYEKLISSRTYFHVTPLSTEVLENWHAYLDLEEMTGDVSRTEHLYERCVIVCANYCEMWVRYASWKEKVQGFEAAKAIYHRATTIFLKYRADIFLEFAAFLENSQHLAEAQHVYENILNNVAPKLVEAAIKYANFERRKGNFSKVKEIFQNMISTADDNGYTYLVLQYASFLDKVVNDVDSTRKVYADATERCSASVGFWLNYVNFEISQRGNDLVDRVKRIFDISIGENSKLAVEDRMQVFDHYQDFVDNYGSTMKEQMEVREKKKLWKREDSTRRKRQLNPSASIENAKQLRSQIYQQYPQTTPVASGYPQQATGTYAASQQQYAAYGNYYQQS